MSKISKRQIEDAIALLLNAAKERGNEMGDYLLVSIKTEHGIRMIAAGEQSIKSLGINIRASGNAECVKQLLAAAQTAVDESPMAAYVIALTKMCIEKYNND